MEIIPLWTVKAKNLIRDIIIADVNNDDEAEVIFSSWDEHVYCVRGQSGTRKWTSKYPTELGGPAERLALVNLNGKSKDTVAATFHKRVLFFSGEDGSYIQDISADGWIENLISVDIDLDGFDEFLLSTRRGSIFLFDDDNSIIFKLTNLGLQTPYSITVLDINNDGDLEIFSGGKEFLLLSTSGDIILRKRYNGMVYTTTYGRLKKDYTNFGIIGHKDGITLVDSAESLHIFNIPGLVPFVITTGDIDGDEEEEIIVGDWGNDSIRIFKMRKNVLKEISKIDLGRNILSLKATDLNGDGIDEILCTTESVNNSVCIIHGKKIDYLDGYPATLGIATGNAMGFGNNDIALRSGRESISLLTVVPRIFAPDVPVVNEKFEIDTVAIGSTKLSIDQKSDTLQKEGYYRTKISNKGYLIFTRYTYIPEKFGTYVLSLKRGSKSLLKRKINIATSSTILPTASHVVVHDEDLLEIRDVNKLKIAMDKVKVKPQKDGTILFSSHVLGMIPLSIETSITTQSRSGARKSSKKSSKDILLFVRRSIGAKITRPKILRSKGKLQVYVQNNTNVSLKIWVSDGKNTRAKSDKILLEPQKDTMLSFDYEILIDSLSANIPFSFNLNYANIQTHVVPLAIRATVINDDRILSLLKELKELQTTREGILKILSEKTGISEAIIEELYPEI